MQSLTKPASVARNMLFALAAQASTTGANLLLALVVAKQLPVAEFSHWQLFTLAGAFAGLAGFGLLEGLVLRSSGSSYAALDKALLGRQFRLLLLANACLAAGGIGFCFAFVPSAGRRLVLCAAAASMLLVNATGFLGGIFQAVGHARLHSMGVLLARGLFAAGAVVLVLLGHKNVLPYLAVCLLGQLVAAVFVVVLARDIVFAKGKTGSAHLRAELARNARAGLVLLLATVANSLLLGSGRLVVDGVWGLATFGRFSFALAVAGLFVQLAAQASMVLLPALRSRESAARQRLYAGLDTALDALLPALLLLYAPLRALLSWWLPAYASSFAWLGLLLPLCLFEGKMGVLYATCFKTERREGELLALNAVGLGLALLLSLFAAVVLHSLPLLAVGLVLAAATRAALARQRVADLLERQGVPGLPGHNRGRDSGVARLAVVRPLLLSAVFMLGAWFLPPVPGFLLYAVAFIVHCVHSAKTIDKTLLLQAKELLKQSEALTFWVRQAKRPFLWLGGLCFCVGAFGRGRGFGRRYRALRALHNRYRGQRCFLIATGPSLTLADLELLQGEICFGVNSLVLALKETRWRPRFYGIQDPHAYRRLEADIRAAGLANIFVADRVLRHGFPPPPGAIPFPLDLDGHLNTFHKVGARFSTNCHARVYDGYSVVYSMIQLAMYMGFAEIVLLGADCDFSGPAYFAAGAYTTTAGSAPYQGQQQRLLAAFTAARTTAEAAGVQLWNATRGGALEVLERRRLEEVLAE